jgi:hypothetical protein
MKQSNYGLAAARMEEMADKFAGYVAVERAEKDVDRNRVMQSLTNLEKQHAKEMAELKAMMMTLTHPVPGAAPVVTLATTRTRGPPVNNGGYCWSHGYLVHSQHTSANCRNKKEGHVDGARRANNFGGSQRGKPHTA